MPTFRQLDQQWSQNGTRIILELSKMGIDNRCKNSSDILVPGIVKNGPWIEPACGVGPRASGWGVLGYKFCRSESRIRTNRRPLGPTHAHPTNWILDFWAMDPWVRGSVEQWIERLADPKGLWIQKAIGSKGPVGTKVQG
jgi:hypothetical protein